MTQTEDTIKTILEVDGTLTGLATGGIWSWTETGRLGITRDLTPTPYDDDGYLKPCLLVKSRSSIPDGEVRAIANQELSITETVEIWFYQDSGYSTIQSMRERVYSLLHGIQSASIFSIEWAGNPLLSMSDDAMGNVSMERSDYLVRSLMS